MLKSFFGNALVHRIAQVLTTLFGTAIVVFVLLRVLPGDQITATYGLEAAALTEGQREELEQYYGIDQPLVVQFFSWLGNIFVGNLGVSSRTGQSVLELTFRSALITTELAIVSILIAWLIGVIFGVLSATKPGSGRDLMGQVVSIAGLSIPSFLLGTTLVTVTANYWMFNPNGKRFALLGEDPMLHLQQILMPALVLGFLIAAPILRTTRAAILEIKEQDFIVTLRAKGVPSRRINSRHLLKNAMLPVITMTGLQFGHLLGGAVVVEQIFAIPGIGRQVILGMQQREYALVQSSVLVIAVLLVAVNLLTDRIYRLVDPRVRPE